jgi:hypothetical protein
VVPNTEGVLPYTNSIYIFTGKGLYPVSATTYCGCRGDTK